MAIPGAHITNTRDIPKTTTAKGRRRGAPELSPLSDFGAHSIITGSVAAWPIQRIHVRCNCVPQTRYRRCSFSVTLPAPVPHVRFLWPWLCGCDIPRPPPVVVGDLAWVPRQRRPHSHSQHLWLAGHPAQIRHHFLGTEIQAPFFLVVARPIQPHNSFRGGLPIHKIARGPRSAPI